jgi:hypothetical protein
MPVPVYTVGLSSKKYPIEAVTSSGMSAEKSLRSCWKEKRPTSKTVLGRAGEELTPIRSRSSRKLLNSQQIADYRFSLVVKEEILDLLLLKCSIDSSLHARLAAPLSIRRHVR